VKGSSPFKTKVNTQFMVNPYGNQSSSIHRSQFLVILLILILFFTACSSATPRSPSLPTTPPLTPTPVPPTPIPGGIYIDPSKSLVEINPFVYGINTGPWTAVPFERNQDALDLQLSFFRYPGGSWGDQNNLREYQIDQYIAYSRQMGAEPSICVRVPGGTPEQAVELVRYANIEKGYNVKYWCIGNEPSLYQTTTIGKDYDTARYNQVWREFALAMRAVDPGILFLGPEIHQYTNNPDYNPKDASGKDWMDEFLIANGDLVDIVSFHRYPFPKDRFTTTTIDDMRANPPEWDAIIPFLRSRIKELTGRDLPVAITEINSHWSQAVGGEATPDSFYNAIWWGDVLARLIRQDVDIVNYFMLPAGPGGFGLFSRTGDIHPTYYTYKMYQHFGSELVEAASGATDVTAYAALRPDGKLTVLAINLSAGDQALPLQLSSEWQLTEAWRLDSTHHAEQIETPAYSNGTPVDLPAQSITLYIFSEP
jgi:hypothetical protein